MDESFVHVGMPVADTARDKLQATISLNCGEVFPSLSIPRLFGREYGFMQKEAVARDRTRTSAATDQFEAVHLHCGCPKEAQSAHDCAWSRYGMQPTQRLPRMLLVYRPKSMQSSSDEAWSKSVLNLRMRSKETAPYERQRAKR